MTWRKTYPTSKSKIKDLPTLHSDNFEAIEDALEYEHYSPASATATLSGAHRLGVVGAVYEGTTTQVTALTGMLSGALAYDTTLGLFVRYSGSAWQAIGQNEWSRVRAYRSTNIAVTADTAIATLVFNTEDYDTLSGYNNSTGIFVAPVSGYYAIIAATSWLASGSQATSAICSATGGMNASLTKTRFPTSDVTVTLTPVGDTPNYNCVDDPIATPDDGTTYVGTTAGYEPTDKYGFTTLDVPAGSTITNVKLYFRIMTTGNAANYGHPHIYVDGTEYSGTMGQPGGNWTTYSSTWTTNPKTTVAWTVNDVNGIGDNALQYFGIGLGVFSGGGGMYCTQVYLEVNYILFTDWIPSGSSNNWENIDEYPTAIDTDLNITETLSAADAVSGTLTTIPSGSTNITVYTEWRGRRRGCVCNNTCYGESCTCNNICYEQSCSCNNTQYGGTGCVCNATCYLFTGKSCTCDYTCYGYVACTCNNTCYIHGCTCDNTSYNPTSGCSCNATCYTEDATRVTPLIRKGDTNYFATQTTPTSAFVNYEGIWLEDPLGGNWTPAGVAAIQGFGYMASTASAGCSADVSQCYLKYNWSPLRPVVGLHVYKNGNVVESVYRPIHEAGAVSYQTTDIMTILKLDPSDQITIRYDKTMIDDTIYAGSEYTYLTIHRLAGNCV